MVMQERKKSDSGSVHSFAYSNSIIASTDSSSISNQNSEIFDSELLQYNNDNGNNYGHIPGAVSVQNSSDVMISPVTQFYGSVMIVQKEETFQKSQIVFKNCESLNDTCPNEQAKVDKLVNPKVANRKRILLLGLITVAAVTLIIISITTLCLVDKKDPLNLEKDNSSTGNVTLGGKYHIFQKSTWGGYKPAYPMTKLQHPTKFAVICHTATRRKTTFQNCSNAMLHMQSYHINSKDQPDIIYNFVVCGDANIYVGRGWDYFNGRMNDSIYIAFVGNYITADELTDDMANAAQLLIAQGVKEQKLSPKYVLVGHNQTTGDTESPGRNVYKIIKWWPHFFGGSVIDGHLVPFHI